MIVTGSIDSVWAAVKEVISSRKNSDRWEIILLDDKQHVLEFTATTKLWRFVDDVKVVISSHGPNSVRVDARSKSRLGKGDMNANINRLRYLLGLIRAQVEQ